MITKDDLRKLAKGYNTTDGELIAALSNAIYCVSTGQKIYFEYDGISVIEILEWDAIDEIEGDVIAVVNCVCGDGSIQKLGYWSSNAETVVDPLDDADTLSSWCQEWLSNTDPDVCPEIVQSHA